MNKFKLHIADRRTGIKREFKTVEAGKAVIYVCGITPYAASHLGHGRSAINFDFLVRVLKFLGYETTYIRNYTDIDDKLLHAAHEQEKPNGWPEIAQRWIADYELHAEKLNCLRPTHSPRVTESIDEILGLIERLVDRGCAYYVENDVYFDVKGFQPYGNFSGKDLESMIAGHRVSVDHNKKHPADFALWKGNDEQKFWESPFGYGRPGWHIECSAMINKFCPDRPLDVHGGGADLIFPHHENEIAQSEAAFDHKLSNFWMHNQFLEVKTEKMSKSTGNALSMENFFKSADYNTFRFFVLQHAYSSPIDFSEEGFLASGKGLSKLYSLFENHVRDLEYKALTLEALQEELTSAEPEQLDFFTQLISTILDDLNSGGALGLVYRNIDKIKSWQSTKKDLLYKILTQIFGLRLEKQEGSGILIAPEIQALIAERSAARVAKDFAKADQIRQKLEEMGHKVSDKPLN